MEHAGLKAAILTWSMLHECDEKEQRGDSKTEILTASWISRAIPACNAL